MSDVVLDPMEISKRGSPDLKNLSQPERFVYLIMTLEALMDMEGWDHFFAYAHYMQHYRELKDGLRAAGDVASVEVLDDYENQFKKWDVPFESDAISEFLNSAPESHFKSSREWRDDFSRLTEARWQIVEGYLSKQGLKLRL